MDLELRPGLADSLGRRGEEGQLGEELIEGGMSVSPASRKSSPLLRRVTAGLGAACSRTFP